MSCRAAAWAVALVAALGAVPALPQNAVREAPVKRPDGTVIAPAPAVDDGSRSPWWRREAEVRAAERERYHMEAEAARQQRAEQSRREREAAAANPARQIAPVQGAR